jgi:rod shape-determining protein MreD
MRNLIAFPILILAVILQSAIVSRVSLLGGFADLPLLIVIAWALQENVTTGWHWAVAAALLMAFVSGIPWLVPMLVFLLAVLVAQALQKRIWQAPLLAMFGVTFFATLIEHLISFVILSVTRTPLPIADTFSLVTLPSVLLNILLAVPVFWFMRDLSRWVFPGEEDE